MNTDFNLSNLSSMFTSESSFNTLVDMINDLDLEVMDMTTKDIYSEEKGDKKLIPSRWHLQAVILVLT